MSVRMVSPDALRAAEPSLQVLQAAVAVEQRVAAQESVALRKRSEVTPRGGTVAVLGAWPKLCNYPKRRPRGCVVLSAICLGLAIKASAWTGVHDTFGRFKVCACGPHFGMR